MFQSTKRLCGISDESGASIERQVAIHQVLGWGALELRTIGGVWVADLERREFERCATYLKRSGIQVTCICARIASWQRPITGGFSLDCGELTVLLERAARLEVPYIRVMSYRNDGLTEEIWRAETIDRLSELVRRAQRAGITLLHENCCGWAANDRARAVELMRIVNSPNFGCIFDSGNPVYERSDGVAYLREILPWVRHVHVKDAIQDPVLKRARAVMVGRGEARITETLSMLEDARYEGYLSIEPHLVHRPHEGVTGTDDELSSSYIASGRMLERILASIDGGQEKSWKIAGGL